MAESKKDIEMLPIDAMEIEMPEVIPLKWEKVEEFFKDHKRCLRFLTTWARVHLKALAAHTKSPTPVPDILIDEIGGEAINETKDKVFLKFNRAHVTNIEKPIGLEMTDEDLQDENIDEMRLLEPARKKRKGPLFKRFLKWKPKKKTKEEEGRDPKELEAEIEKARLLSYEDLKISFATFLEEEVYRHREARDLRRAARGEQVTPENLESKEARWISDMTHRLHVCHMAFKILGIVREKCEDLASTLAYSDLGPDICFQGSLSNLMQGRLAYLQTTKTLALIMVSDIEKMQMDSEIYAECVEMFERVLRSEQKLLSRKDSVEKKVIKCMKDHESILNLSPTRERIAENMLKSESQQNLLLAAEEPDSIIRDHSIFDTKTQENKALANTSGSSADLTSPNVVFSCPLTTSRGALVFRCLVSEDGLTSNAKQCLYYQPEPAANSISGYSSASLLSQSPAGTLEDSSPRGGKSFLNLPDPLAGGSRQEPTSKEGSTSPMQTSPAEKMPSDEDSTDNLKEC